MAHFRKNHAIGSILCSICDRPIRSSKGPNDFRRHYAYKHPNHPMPFNIGPIGSPSARKINNKANIQIKQVSFMSYRPNFSYNPKLWLAFQRNVTMKMIWFNSNMVNGVFRIPALVQPVGVVFSLIVVLMPSFITSNDTHILLHYATSAKSLSELMWTAMRSFSTFGVCIRIKKFHTDLVTTQNNQQNKSFVQIGYVHWLWKKYGG